MDKKLVKSIALGGIFAALYAILTIISVYVVNIFSVLGLFILPIFAAYYASIFKFKEIIIFNISTIFVSFLAGIADPFYVLLYVLPTLIVGDMFGLLYKLKLKYFTTIFLQAITYSITNILALYLGEIIYNTEIIRFLISDQWIYQNLSLSILFVLSGAEAVFSTMFIDEQLKAFNGSKEKETTLPLYGYIAIVTLSVLSIVMYFINYNFYFLFIVMNLFIIAGLAIELSKKIKKFNVLLIIYIFFVVCLEFLLAYFKLYYLIVMAIVCPFTLYCLVKIIIIIYNNIKNGSD